MPEREGPEPPSPAGRLTGERLQSAELSGKKEDLDAGRLSAFRRRLIDACRFT